MAYWNCWFAGEASVGLTYDGLVSEAEYLKIEEAAPEKSEYVAGRIFAMSGASGAHNRIVMNLSRMLYDVAEPSGCEVFASDMKLKIEALRTFYYPDLIVTCEHVDDSAYFATAPFLVVEVLSPSTTAVDRREKLQAYLSVSSLRQYLIVHQRSRLVELYTKNEELEWDMHEFTDFARFSIVSPPGRFTELNVEDIYRGCSV